MSRVVVVGAGVGGLAAAARLSALGHQVVVCEQAAVVGGKLGWLERAGFGFDTGPSLLTMPYVFEELFRDCGSRLEDRVALRRLDPIARYRFSDGTTFDAVDDLDRFAAILDGALAPGAGQDWRRFMAHAARVWAATRVPFLESALGGPAALLRHATRVRDLATIKPWATLRSLGAEHLHDPRLRTYLDRYATYTGSDPRRAPAALAVVPYVEQTFGASYVEGGLYRLGLAIADLAVERGALLLTGTDVVEITRSGDRVDGVRLADGHRLPADVVVANADAAHVYGHLVSSPAASRRLAKAAPSLSGFVLLLGLRGRTPGLAHHTVSFPADYDAEFDAVFAGRPAADPTIYISCPDDPAVRPDDDSEAWFVLVNAPRHGTGDGCLDWAAPGLAESYADRILDLLAARGFPVRDRIIVQETRTPADLAQATRAVGGAIYGTSANTWRSAFLRPANRSPVPGLFLVGGSSHPGGGLPLVALSARIVAGLIRPAADA